MLCNNEYNNECKQLYPDLNQFSENPSAPPLSDHNFRLQKISEIQDKIECERIRREILSKKYHRAVRIISVVDNTLLASTMALGAVGIGFLTTIVGTPVAIACEGAALGMGVLSLIGSQAIKKLTIKAEKHEKIKVLADAKLNTISSLISKAISDQYIDDVEFNMILSELEKFQTMTEQIRTKSKNDIDEQTKESIFNKGIEKGKSDVIEVLNMRFNKNQNIGVMNNTLKN
ncbi:TPA_asm: SLATT [Hydra adintovirus]|nr:TPA_asm: SLATT [Hydra adintovirus]